MRRRGSVGMIESRDEQKASQTFREFPKNEKNKVTGQNIFIINNKWMRITRVISL